MVYRRGFIYLFIIIEFSWEGEGREGGLLSRRMGEEGKGGEGGRLRF